jgi:hypothetical protein
VKNALWSTDLCRWARNNLIIDYKLNINLREELLTKDNIVVFKGSNKKKKIIKLITINLESKLNLKGNRLA